MNVYKVVYENPEDVAYFQAKNIEGVAKIANEYKQETQIPDARITAIEKVCELSN